MKRVERKSGCTFLSVVGNASHCLEAESSGQLQKYNHVLHVTSVCQCARNTHLWESVLSAFRVDLYTSKSYTPPQNTQQLTVIKIYF